MKLIEENDRNIEPPRYCVFSAGLSNSRTAQGDSLDYPALHQEWIMRYGYPSTEHLGPIDTRSCGKTFLIDRGVCFVSSAVSPGL
ncbi:hypothetical protein RRG08_061022 [Elysia crispata]|uniref:Uncharacterized protein n=1 Tax=Elysia crispata TaxID=231223 RepID=A0AAE1E671_9GAST|nr:hypothetical protein RRG08_061022 [Elysia crispata]